MEKERKQKMFLIIELGILAFFALCFLILMIIQLAAPDIAFSLWMKENVWDVEATFTALQNNLKTFVMSLIAIITILIITTLVRLVLKAQMKRSNRAKTIITLADGFIKYGCAIAVIFLFLRACGVNTGALIASVGVLTLVVGLGAQTLIADIIAGLFIIFENEYNVGETVTIDDFRGKVIDIGVRTTRLLDAAGNIKIINNSNINNVINMSRELSLAVIVYGFPYDYPTEKIENIINDNLDRVASRIPAILAGPFYKGIEEYGDSNIFVKIVAQCHEDDRFQVQRDLLREYRILMNENGIDISFQRVVISSALEKEEKVSKKEKRQANEFLDEQKDVSKDIDDGQNI